MVLRPAVRYAVLSHANEQSGPITAAIFFCSIATLIAAIASDESQATSFMRYSSCLPCRKEPLLLMAFAASDTAPTDARIKRDEFAVGIRTASVRVLAASTALVSHGYEGIVSYEKQGRN
jgi:hypothetical protein